MQQLTLPVRLPDDATFSNFYFTPSNQSVFNCLKAFCAEQVASYVYLWGNAGVGCTHLLQACCQHLQDQALRVAYFSLTEKTIRPAILESLENLDLVCVDDLEEIAGDAAWEEALFHFFNRMQNHKHRLLVAAHKAPPHLGLFLPDLASRLTGGIVFQVQELNDEEKVHLLKMRANSRGFELSDQVGQFLLTRMPRDVTRLFNALELLDAASLAAKRKLTIPFVKSILRFP